MSNPSPFWLFLGASAGGLEALKQFLLYFHAYDRCVTVIAQHLDPKHPTILKDLLERVTQTPIEMVTEATRPQPGRIYIVSPGHNAQVNEARIELTPAAEVGPKPSIDVLLHSASQALGEKAVVAILSGTGSDGARGAMAVKSCNGLVFAQNEASCRYSGMPLSAVEAGAVDKTAPPDQLAQEITGFMQGEHQAFEAVEPDPKTDLERIFQRLYEVTGHDFSGYKLKTIRRRLARRMVVNQCHKIEDYVALLEKSELETQQLLKDMMISVTAFFRDQQAFQALETELEQRITANTEPNKVWRIWVPGCANGEEPYSIAIVMHRIKTRLNLDLEYQVFASDIDEYALSQARKGLFSQAQVMDLQPATLEHYFVKRDRHYEVSKRVRDRVVFAKQNLVMEPPFSRLDLISCRNLMIYFSPDLQRQVLKTFHFALNPNGLLFMGKSESASSATPELFAGVAQKAQIYERKATSLSQRSDRIQSANAIKQPPTPRTVSLESTDDKASIAQTLEKKLLSQMLPVAIVVDQSGHIMHIRGDVNRFLNFPQGRIDTNVITLARDDIKVDLRALLDKAKKHGYSASQALFYKDEAAADQALFLSVQPMQFPQSSAQLYVIAFITTRLTLPYIEPGQDPDGADASKAQLQKEVALFKERLQASVQDLETTNEELQSTNEELQSSNEELQSSNEELQTANEELQSTNEELSTVNEELEVKTHELEQVNTDLQSMLENMSEKILLLDSRLRLLRYTRPAAELFGLDASHLHHTVTTLGLELDVTNLRQELLSVLERETPMTLRVRIDGQVYALRLVPHHAQERGTKGILLFFDQPNSAVSLESGGNRALIEHLGAQVSAGLVVIDQLGIMVYANQKILSQLGYSWEALRLQNVKQLMPEPYRGHHDGYLEDYQKGTSSGLMSQWRDVTALRQNGERVLLKLKTEAVQFDEEVYYLGFLKTQKEWRDEGSVRDA